jgi:hypothetical protein
MNYTGTVILIMLCRSVSFRAVGGLLYRTEDAAFIIVYHMPCHAMPCHAMPCHAMPCHAMPCHAMPCHAMPCVIVLYSMVHYTVASTFTFTSKGMLRLWVLALLSLLLLFSLLLSFHSHSDSTCIRLGYVSTLYTLMHDVSC